MWEYAYGVCKLRTNKKVDAVYIEQLIIKIYIIYYYYYYQLIKLFSIFEKWKCFVKQMTEFGDNLKFYIVDDDWWLMIYDNIDLRLIFVFKNL